MAKCNICNGRGMTVEKIKARRNRVCTLGNWELRVMLCRCRFSK